MSIVTLIWFSLVLKFYCWFLLRFCSQLGTIFNFVVKDIEDKLWRLNELMRQDNSNFVTVKAMILYERSNGELAHNSGCITLLRLHRGLGIVNQNNNIICISKY